MPVLSSACVTIASTAYLPPLIAFIPAPAHLHCARALLCLRHHRICCISSSIDCFYSSSGAPLLCPCSPLLASPSHLLHIFLRCLLLFQLRRTSTSTMPVLSSACVTIASTAYLPPLMSFIPAPAHLYCARALLCLRRHRICCISSTVDVFYFSSGAPLLCPCSPLLASPSHLLHIIRL